MLVYYLGVVHLKARVRLGMYTDGIWTDSGFMPWSRIDAVSWQEKPRLALLVVSRARSVARRLTVPGDALRSGAAGAARAGRVARPDAQRCRADAGAARRRGGYLKSGIRDQGSGIRERRR